MKRLLLVLCLLTLGMLPTQAENYPHRSDVLWVTVPDHTDWLYKTGEKASVEVQFYKYGIPQDGVTIRYEIGGDLMPADKSGSVVLKHGRAVIPIGTMKQPGFRDCRMTAEVDGTTYRHHIKVGFSPEKSVPSP
ncbi:MAG: acetylxylan esterase, partial [Alistipes sp.]|nr:acetylxylan esterase [Alistipes sp.]